MKRIILAALLLAPVSLSNCAALAQETVHVSVGTVTEEWTLTPTDQQKFEAWVKTAYACTPVAPAATCETVLADAESAWAKATLQGTADNVTRFQNTVAATAAVQATTPIGFNVEGRKRK